MIRIKILLSIWIGILAMFLKLGMLLLVNEFRVVGSNSLRLHATETKWGDKVIFGKDGLDEENHLLLDPTSKYHYHKIPHLARIGISLQMYG